VSDLELHAPATDDIDPPPPLTLEGPDGSRVTVDLANSSHTVAELADALGIPRRAAVLVDGRPVDRRARLDRSGLVNGSRVTGRPARAACRAEREVAAHGDVHGHGRILVTVEAGPAAGAEFVLPQGRHLIGRSTACAVRLDDDLVELHHAVVDVGPETSTLVQLAGRVPCSSSPADREREAAAAAVSVVTIGGSRLRFAAADRSSVSPPAALAPRRDDPWRVTLHRPPRQPIEWAPASVEPPADDLAQPRRSAGGLLAGALSVVAGVVLAIVMGHPMYLIFSCIGVTAAAGSALSRRVGDHRRRRLDAAESRRDYERFIREVAAQHEAREAHQRGSAPTIAAALRIVGDLSSELWARRANHVDGFTVSLGWGSMNDDVLLAGAAELSAEAAAIVDRHRLLDDVPVTTSLGPAHSVAIVGEHSPAVARALIVQLAALTGPADWRLVVVADDPDAWEWAAWLPHVSSGGHGELGPMVAAADDQARLTAILAHLDGDDGRHVVVVTDRPDALSTRTGALRRLLAAAPSVAVIAVVRPGGVVPPLCRSELRVGSLCTGRWCPDLTSAPASHRIHAAGVSAAAAGAAARRIARLHDPEDPDDAAGACPVSVTLSRMLARSGRAAIDDPIAIAATWGARRRGDGDGAIGGHPRAAIGLTADGVVEVDLVGDGPHALIAGTTGAGKSELLRTLVVALAAGSSPDDLSFVLVDYKGGSTFDACADLPHTVGVVTDLDDRLAERALVSLEAELRRRERLLRQAGVDDLDSYRSVHGEAAPLPRLVVVIDEFAAMAADLPGFVPALVGVAQRGRSLGIHLVLATQRPAGVVSDEIRANTNLRIALRLQDRADAVDIVGTADPASFPRGNPGRAMLRLGAGETVVFQTGHSSGEHRPVDRALHVRRGTARDAGPAAGSGPDPGAGRAGAVSELTALTRAIRAAASLSEVRPPFRPWLEPLPPLLPADSLEDDAVGLVDEPAAQRQVPLHWVRGAGNLALIGALGSGTTTALRSLIVAAGPEAHCYVVDAHGDELLAPIAALPNCGAVVGLHDTERRVRLVRFLADELARRQADSTSPRQPIILGIDGLGALLASLAGPADIDDYGRLLRVLTDGVSAGIHTVATMERPGGVSHAALAALTQRWLFHVDDPIECVGLGVRAAAVPPPMPGRIVLTDRRCEAQLAVLPVPPNRRLTVGTPPPPAIGTLREDVDAGSLPPSTHRDGTSALTIGIDFATLAPVELEVPDGEHVLVAGPARSGRSTALQRLIAGWRDAHRDGVVVVHCPRMTSPVIGWVRTAVPDAFVVDNEEAVIAAVAHVHRRVLVAVDDAERVVDADGRLTTLTTDRHPDVTVIAAGRPDTLRTMYGHWTAVVRRSRIGLVMSTGADTDGDLFGEPLPRRSPVPPRPGLAWMIDAGARRLVQVARQPVVAASAGDDPRPIASRQDTRLPPLRIERE
jgi:DNA segregation ATPase FtsK/SpoIIIE, S-DNA-T family